MREVKVRNVTVKKCREVGVNRPGYCFVVEPLRLSNREYLEQELGNIEDVVKDLLSGKKYTALTSEVLSTVLLKSGVVEPEELLMVKLGEIRGQGLRPL